MGPEAVVERPRRVRLDPARATAPALQPRPKTRPRVLVVQELVGFFTVHRHGLVHEDVDRRHGEGMCWLDCGYLLSIL